MGLTSGMTQAAANWARDAPSLVPSPCHVSDLARGLNQPAGTACVGDRTPLQWGWRQDWPRGEGFAHCCPPAPTPRGYSTVQAAPDPLPLTPQPLVVKQGVRVFPGNATL